MNPVLSVSTLSSLILICIEYQNNCETKVEDKIKVHRNKLTKYSFTRPRVHEL